MIRSAASKPSIKLVMDFIPETSIIGQAVMTTVALPLPRGKDPALRRLTVSGKCK
jgi:hypothetical protein